MVLHGPGHHASLKLLGSSVTVRDDTLIRGSPGQSGTVRVGCGKVRSGTVLIRGDPACLVGDFC